MPAAGTMVAMASADQPVTAVDPHQITDPRVRERLRESYDGEGDEWARISPWVGTGVVALLAAAAIVAAVAGLAIVPVLIAAAAVALVGIPAWQLVATDVTASRLERWRRTSAVVTAHQQQDVAERAPELGERLVRAAELTSLLRQPQERAGSAACYPGSTTRRWIASITGSWSS
jgi:hypothetical protein